MQKKVEIKAEEEVVAVKPVLNEANSSDDDVWEPSLRKDKTPVLTSKPTRHSTKKKVLNKFANTFFVSQIYFDTRKRRKEDIVLRLSLGITVAEKELLHPQIQEVKVR